MKDFFEDLSPACIATISSIKEAFSYQKKLDSMSDFEKDAAFDYLVKSGIVTPDDVSNLT